jgi:hypothetical protein
MLLCFLNGRVKSDVLQLKIMSTAEKQITPANKCNYTCALASRSIGTSCVACKCV